MIPPETSEPTFTSLEWRYFIVSGADDMGIGVSDVRLEKLVRFAQLLSEWNRQVNLTAITESREVAVKHFLDSMAALPHIPETGRLMDIGSGGGFPGLVLAIFRPSLFITSIDSVRKKISFQQHLIRTLGLKSAEAVHARAESLPDEKERYDIVVSRALGSLDMFVTLALPILSEEGKIIAYKGVMNEAAEEEIETLKSRYKDLLVEVCSYFLPSSGDQRSLVFIRRK